MKRVGILIIILSAMSYVSVCHAEIVSWNYNSYGDAYGTQSTDVAGVGVYSASYWNDSYLDGRTTDLLDNTGAATTIDISWSSYNTWQIQQSHPGTDTDGSYNKEVINGYLNAGPADWNPPQTYSDATLSEIGYSSYDIVVYFSSDVADREGYVTDGSTTYYFKTLGPASIAGGNASFIQATDTTTSGYNTAANYAVFSGLSGASQTVTVQMRDTDEWGGIAAVQIVESPGKAWDPDPDSGAVNVGTANGNYVQLTLKWKTGLDPCDANNVDPNITQHYLYLDTCDVNLGYNQGDMIDTNIVASGADANYLITNLAYSTTYHWRVDESVLNSGPNDPGTRTGSEWFFTTIGEAPEITVQPDDVLAEIGDVNIVFTVGVASASDVNYQWYKSDDGTVSMSTDTQVGTDSNTYTIASVTAGDDAYYYVYVENDAGPTQAEISEVVHLWLEREIGRWKLDNNRNDSSAAAKGGTAEWDAIGGSGDFNSAGLAFDESDPNDDTGNYSMRFYDEPNAFLSVVDTNYFNHYVVGLTASCWVKTNGDLTGWDPIIAKQSRSSSTTGDQGWVLESSSGTPIFQVRNAGVWAQGPIIDDSNWHMVTAVYDIEHGNARLYVDGQLDGNDTDINPGGAVKSIDRFTIGSEDSNEGALPSQAGSIDAWIDDVRIFTYPMTSEQVAGMYFDTLPDANAFCVDGDLPELDITGDCKVNFADYAIMAQAWLDCNLYPPSACNE